MINKNYIKVEQFAPKNEKAHAIIKKLCDFMELQYKNEYKDRFIKMIENNILKNIFIILYNNLPVGFILFVSSKGSSFNEDKIVLKLTMFRVVPHYRNKGIGKTAFAKINKIIFHTYDINVIYAESIEYGALKLYSKLENIHFFENQYTNNIKFSLDILHAGLPNNFLFSDEIKFKIINPNYLNDL